MSKCPKCKKEINHLIECRTQEGETKITANDDMDDTLNYDCPEWGNIIKCEYHCPECKEVLISEEDEELVKQFLINGLLYFIEDIETEGLEVSEVWANCEECGADFEGKRKIDKEGLVKCPVCRKMIQNWGEDGWSDNDVKDAIKL